jgi:hypothetical protein
MEETLNLIKKTTWGLITLMFLFFPIAMGTEWDIEKFGLDMGADGLIFFKGYIYKIKSGDDLYRSEGINQSGERVVGSLHGNYLKIHNDRLFVLFKNSTFFYAMIYHTGDGETWDTFQVPQGTSEEVRGAISFGEYLYVAMSDGRVMRISGISNDGITLDWEWIQSLESIQPPFVNHISFVIFQGKLHAAISAQTYENNESATLTHIYRLETQQNGTENAGTTWEEDPVATFKWDISTGEARTFLAVHNDQLYFSGDYLWRTTGTQTPYDEWEKVDFFSDQFRPIPIVIQNRLHVWSGSHPVMILSSEGKWKQGSRQESHIQSSWQVNDTTPLTINGEIYVPLYPYLWTIRPGVSDVKYNPVAIEEVFSGQTQVGVLGFAVKTNFGESVNLTVINEGSAVHGHDIKTVHLVRLVGDDTSQPTTEVLGTLHPDPSDPEGKTWALASPVALGVNENLLITIDAAPTARTNKTIRMAVTPENLRFGTHTTFELPWTMSGFRIEMKEAAAAAGLGSIAEVLVFPQPARNQVQFAYDLASPSNVTISIFNQQGLRLSEIKDYHAAAGDALKSAWDCTHVPSGTYYAHIKIEGSDGSTRQFTKSVFIKK